MLQRLLSIGTGVLGVLLIAQGVGKVVDFAGYLDALAMFDVFPHPLSLPVAGLWSLAEVGSGLLLVLGPLGRLGPGPAFRFGAWVALGIALAYMVLTGQAWARELAVSNCTCFGSYFPQAISPFVLSQDVVVILWTAWVLRGVPRASPT